MGLVMLMQSNNAGYTAMGAPKRRTDRRTDGPMDGRTNGRMDGQTLF